MSNERFLTYLGILCASNHSNGQAWKHNLLLNVFHIFVDPWIIEIIHNHKGGIKNSKRVSGIELQFFVERNEAYTNYPCNHKRK
jgi:hypothetical protein